MIYLFALHSAPKQSTRLFQLIGRGMFLLGDD